MTADIPRLRYLRTLCAPSKATPTAPADLSAATGSIRQTTMDIEMSLPPTTSTPPSLAAQIKANDVLFLDPVYIPPASSPLNLLLAYESVTKTIAGSLESIPRVEKRLQEAKVDLERVQAECDEEKALQAALERRLDGQEEDEKGQDGDADEVAEMQRTAKALAVKTAQLQKRMRKFIEDSLVEILETEELGGVTAGSGEVGQGVRGRRKRGGGQRTIEELWGMRMDEDRDVGVEMMELLEELMNAVESGEPYILLPGETASVRFLVRVGVAKFHPRDARKLRLVGFGDRFDE